MGAFLDKPKTEKKNHSGESNGLKFASSSMQGWRMEMEDSDVCDTNLGRLQGWSFFGVFDGHAGTKVSKYCSEQLWGSIVKHLGNSSEPSIEEVKKALEKGFIELDEGMRKVTPWSTGEDHSGSTAVVVLISPTHIFWANCGDSRSIFCSNGQLGFATMDHKPSNTIEKDRIEKAGGTVMMQRVNGTLAVSRALGDFDYKRDTTLKSIQQLVSPQPDISVRERNKDTDEFLVLACDGIYDVMTNEEVISFIHRKLQLIDSVTTCNELIDTCLMKNSRDNMSVVLVTFPASPCISEKSIAEEQELQAKVTEEIQKALEEMVNGAGDPLEIEENHVFQTIANTMPMEYYIYEKRQYIVDILKELSDKKFGTQVNGDFTGPSDSSHAPLELQSGGSDQIVLGTEKDEGEGYHGYDSALLGINSPVDDEEEKMDTSTQGEGPVIVSKESEDDHT